QTTTVNCNKKVGRYVIIDAPSVGDRKRHLFFTEVRVNGQEFPTNRPAEHYDF
ncbi:unnamed protein product, partial [Amoebophrya sp. A25]